MQFGGTVTHAGPRMRSVIPSNSMMYTPTMPVSNLRSRVRPVARFAWATLCCNVAVVLWGAYVRATGSGAGCGNKWPLCGGDVLSTSARSQTIIEFTHRMTSGFVLLMVASLVVWCWRVTSRRDWARYIPWSRLSLQSTYCGLSLRPHTGVGQCRKWQLALWCSSPLN